MKKAILLVLSLAVIGAAPALAFHDAGVAHCNGCHTMHNSENGVMPEGSTPGGNEYLLKRATPSDTCLGCHAGDGGGYHVFATDPLVPTDERGAGDFVFLTEDNINDGHAGASNPILGYAAGHSIVAPGHGLPDPDPVLTTAPGGGTSPFLSENLGCTSCHDPHGNTNFRMLYGQGDIQGGSFNFGNAAPTAEGLNLFFGVESNSNHTAYQGGMSAWCGNCHGEFHLRNGGQDLIHPSGSTMGGGIAGAYNGYNGTTSPTGNPSATAYLAAVPFEDGTNAVGRTEGPDAGSQVSCITCHRAHATSAPNAGRWDFNVTFLVEDGHESGSYTIPNPYVDTAGDDQRSLCNKCHVKDAGDGPFPGF